MKEFESDTNRGERERDSCHSNSNKKSSRYLREGDNYSSSVRDVRDSEDDCSVYTNTTTTSNSAGKIHNILIHNLCAKCALRPL